MVAVVVVAGSAFITWLGLRPQPCDGKFSSTLYSYCLEVPAGWSSSIAHIGPTDVDQFVSRTATTVITAFNLPADLELAGYARIALQIDTQKGLTAGPKTQARLGGIPAFEWKLSMEGGRFQGLEVVAVNGDVGWTLQLNDDEATFAAHVDQFHSMLSSFHFR